MASQPAQNVKKYRRGEFLYKEGDKAETLFLIQSGKVAICVIRPSARIEIMVAGAGHVVGDQALFGLSKHIYSAEAMGEVSVLELPVAFGKAQLESAGQFTKALLKSLSEDVKSLQTEIKSVKMEKESVACPQLFVPRLFSTINLVTRHLGKKNEAGFWELAWGSLRIFGVRMFLEAPQRLQSTVELLTKLKHMEMHFEVNEEGETELSRLTIKNLQLIEDFGEFYQYNLYKGGTAEILIYDDIACNLARVMVLATEGLEPDRQGAVRITFDQVGEKVKEELGVAFKNTHIDLLEKKGLFMKRTPTDKEVWLSFDRKEFQQTYLFWQIIHEIDKWNATGRVNMQEEEKKKPKPGERVCPECSAPAKPDQKFCGECGAKLPA